ncbi:MAG: tRNA (adenosine(37)-N6)-threonylcarbamoyltransferase complex transferase subunit TsaD [Thermodesulfovibrionales bacterium]
MIILGIDTSCDDTSASVVEDGRKILSNIISGQEGIHKKYGGIVPELASRRHIEMIWPVVDEALRAADTPLGGLSAVAVCHGPGLIGSLLVGCSFAKAVCYSKGIPLVAVNHLEGHIFSCFLDEKYLPDFPFLSLIVSGGHTSLYRVDGFGKYKELGRTRDDAAGEAYDKVSKLLGLGYPGGPVIDRLAQDGDPDAIDFPRAYLPGSLDFSFSGLKTAVVNFLRSNKETVNDIAASFQAAIVDVLVRKTGWAIREEGIKRIALSGGVAANSAVRKEFARLAEGRGVEVFFPPIHLCTDNAAMIASAGYHHFIAHDVAGLDLNPEAYLPL